MMGVFGLIPEHEYFGLGWGFLQWLPTDPGRNLEGFMTAQEKARFEARVVVMRDTEISYGARVLYWYLDDMAGWKGETYPRQKTTLKAIGASLTHLKRFYRELEGRHVFSSRRKGSASIRSLRWVGPRAASLGRAAGGLGVGPRAALAYSIEPDLIEPGTLTDEEKSKPACDCAGSGYYPLGSGQPCRECEAGWKLAKTQRRRA
jgi:hypothetical protein